jgi:hypothetical protein
MTIIEWVLMGAILFLAVCLIAAFDYESRRVRRRYWQPSDPLGSDAQWTWTTTTHRCSDCGHELTLVRPGKYQCDWCEREGLMTAIIAVNAALKAEVAQLRGEQQQQTQAATRTPPAHLRDVEGAK